MIQDLHFLGMLGYTLCGIPRWRLGYDCEKRFTQEHRAFRDA